MSHPQYDFWVHGASVQVEFPEKTTLIARQGSGTIVRQDLKDPDKKSDYNWFHFPIPTPTVIDGMSVTYNDAWLHYSEQTNAKITDVHVHDMAYPTGMCPTCTNGVIFKTDANWSKDPGRDKSSDTVWFNLIDFQAFEGAVLSARVEFYRPSGSIKFLGVGMRFYRTEATGWTGHV